MKIDVLIKYMCLLYTMAFSIELSEKTNSKIIFCTISRHIFRHRYNRAHFESTRTNIKNQDNYKKIMIKNPRKSLMTVLGVHQNFVKVIKHLLTKKKANTARNSSIGLFENFTKFLLFKY